MILFVCELLISFKRYMMVKSISKERTVKHFGSSPVKIKIPLIKTFGL